MSFQPPPGPPPGPPPPGKFSEEAPPPYHDWTVIPDTSLLPPPPALSHLLSPGANATADDAQRADSWCAAYPLWEARQLSYEQLHAIHTQNQTFVTPPNFTGEIYSIAGTLGGTWICRSRPGTTDSLLQTQLPIYSALADSPLVTERMKTIYFEVKIIALGAQTVKPPQKHGLSLFSRHKRQPSPARNEEVGVGIGFFAPPCPPFRLPGWQRGSLGVHSDDGHRYVNNNEGGLDFTAPFQVGETVGIGMSFSIPSKPPAYGESMTKLDVEVFFTREGKRVGGWDLYEERDIEEDLMGIGGLEGGCDLFPAVGIFGGTEVEVRFRPGEWLYRPKGI